MQSLKSISEMFLSRFCDFKTAKNLREKMSARGGQSYLLFSSTTSKESESWLKEILGDIFNLTFFDFGTIEETRYLMSLLI